MDNGGAVGVGGWGGREREVDSGGRGREWRGGSGKLKRGDAGKWGGCVGLERGG